MVINAIENTLSLFIFMGVGFYLRGKSWFGEKGADIFCKYPVRVAIPCYMVYNVITTSSSPQELLEIVRYMPISIVFMLMTLGLGLVLCKLFGVAQERRGVFINGVAFSNTVLIGFPVISGLFGQEAVPLGMIYYTANTLLFWTVGTYLLRQDSGQQAQFFTCQNCKKFFSPPIWGLLIGVALVLLRVELPGFAFSSLEKIAHTSTPIALMFIGSILRSTDYKKLRLTKDLLVIVLTRAVIAPAMMALLCMSLPISTLMRQVLFILSTMPARTQLGIMAKEYESDYAFASAAVAVTSAICLPMLPLYILLIEQFGLFV